MSKKRKKLLIIVPLVVLAIIIILCGTLSFKNAGQILYNADLFQLELPKANILFARPGDCGFSLSSCSKLDIYKISSDGTGLKHVYSIDSSEWPSKETGSQFQENTLSNSMGTFDGKAEAGNKRIEINRVSIRTTEMVLLDGSEKTILEKRDDFFIGLDIDSLQWMPDARHLLIEESQQRIGIYDTVTRKYAYLSDGFLAIPSTSDSSF